MSHILRYFYSPCLSLLLILSPHFAKADLPQSPLDAGILLAQADPTADPFADYSEFEETAEEEKDINFFKNGRFFTIGLIFGARDFTENLASIGDTATPFGILLSYFFDLRFAMQFSYITGDHNLRFTGESGTPVSVTTGLSQFSIDFKYYFNTQNVTKGLADLNPYLIAGFGQVERDSSEDGNFRLVKDSNLGVNIGVGLEIPILQRDMYMGAQVAYHVVNFEDENTEITLNDSEPTGIYPTGDLITYTAVIGVNF